MHASRIPLFSSVLTAALLTGIPAPAEDAGTMSMKALRTERAKIAQRPHRVIFDNDGMDGQFIETHTPNALLDVRTRQLTKTKVTTVFYCSRSSGLGVFTHNTKVGEVFTSTVGRYKDNATADLIAQGTDPLRLVTDFCRANDLEVFWTLRMNDCHDVIHRPDNPYPAFSKLKAAHPEWLMGRRDKRPPHGNWSAYDFAVPEVRQLVVDCIAEVCRGYDVDGIHLDFFRHLNYFRSVANGGQATSEELELMTDLIRRIRQTTEELGLARGRPFLLAARVPDSVPYCRGIGLDIEAWLTEGLLDLLVAGEFHLNPLSQSVELGHRHGVQIIVGVSDSRVHSERGPFRRLSEESYRARVAAAWAAGCDGVYLFNLYRAERPFLSEIHDPALLSTLEQHAFVTVRPYAESRRWLSGGPTLATRPLLTPDHPWLLKPKIPRKAEFELGDPAGRSALLMALVPHADAELTFSVGKHPLESAGKEGDWFRFRVPAGLLHSGLNQVDIELTKAVSTRQVFGAADIPKQWGLRGHPGKKDVFGKQQPQGLLIVDRGTDQGDYHYRSYAWAAGPGSKASFSAKVKHITGWSSFAFANGRNEERVKLYTDHIEVKNGRLRHDMITTDAFHEYRVEIQGYDFRIFVDGTLCIDGTNAYRGTASGGRTMVLLGAATSGDTGEAIWQEVVIETSDVALQDLVLVLPGSGK